MADNEMTTWMTTRIVIGKQKHGVCGEGEGLPATKCVSAGVWGMSWCGEVGRRVEEVWRSVGSGCSRVRWNVVVVGEGGGEGGGRGGEGGRPGERREGGKAGRVGYF